MPSNLSKSLFTDTHTTTTTKRRHKNQTKIQKSISGVCFLCCCCCAFFISGIGDSLNWCFGKTCCIHNWFVRAKQSYNVEDGKKVATKRNTQKKKICTNFLLPFDLLRYWMYTIWAIEELVALKQYNVAKYCFVAIVFLFCCRF